MSHILFVLEILDYHRYVLTGETWSVFQPLVATSMRDSWWKEQEYTVGIVHDLAPRTLVW